MHSQVSNVHFVMRGRPDAACIAGCSALFVVTADMLMDLHASQADRTYKRVLRKYVKPEVLFLDEFAYEPFDSAATSHLYRVVSARHKTGSTIIAADCGFTAWKKLFPSEERAVATVDRLADEATILRFTGESCRKPREITGAPLDEQSPRLLAPTASGSCPPLRPHQPHQEPPPASVSPALRPSRCRDVEILGSIVRMLSKMARS